MEQVAPFPSEGGLEFREVETGRVGGGAEGGGNVINGKVKSGKH